MPIQPDVVQIGEGCHPDLCKKWPAYKAWDYSSVCTQLKDIIQARNSLNHNEVTLMPVLHRCIIRCCCTAFCSGLIQYWPYPVVGVLTIGCAANGCYIRPACDHVHAAGTESTAARQLCFAGKQL